MIKQKGYTLMELLVVITVMVFLMVGGTSLFLSNLRSSALSELTLKTARAARDMADSIESRIRYAKILEVGGRDRDYCLEVGSDGVEGNSILYENSDRSKIKVSLEDGKIASSSSKGVIVDYLSGGNVTVTNLVVKWYCRGGINDKIDLDIYVTGAGQGIQKDVTEIVSRELLLLNSGLR